MTSFRTYMEKPKMTRSKNVLSESMKLNKFIWLSIALLSSAVYAAPAPSRIQVLNDAYLKYEKALKVWASQAAQSDRSIDSDTFVVRLKPIEINIKGLNTLCEILYGPMADRMDLEMVHSKMVEMIVRLRSDIVSLSAKVEQHSSRHNVKAVREEKQNLYGAVVALEKELQARYEALKEIQAEKSPEGS